MFNILPILDGSAGFDISSFATTVLPFAGVFAVFYFMIIRPESKRKKETQKMLDELKVGDDVTTRGGIYGKVYQIKDDKVIIETGPDHTKIQLMRWAVASTGSVATPAQ